jgi:hypothetical protein
MALVENNVSEERIAYIISMLQLLVTTSVVPSWLILFTLMMEAIHTPETSVLKRATRRNIQEDRILRSHRRGNLKSYTTIDGSESGI